MTKPRLEAADRVLLVDDMVDSATGWKRYKELPKRFPHITALKTAVPRWSCSVFKPDYFVEYLP